MAARRPPKQPTETRFDEEEVEFVEDADTPREEEVLRERAASPIPLISDLDAGFIEEVVLERREQATQLVTVAELAKIHETAVTVAEEEGLPSVVDTQIHIGSFKNEADKIAFTTSIVPDQKAQVKHTGPRVGKVETPAEQTRISIKVFPDNLDTKTTRVLAATVKDHKFYIKAKSAAAITNFIEKCKDSSIVMTLEFNENVTLPNVKFTGAEIKEINARLKEAQTKYLDAHPDENKKNRHNVDV